MMNAECDRHLFVIFGATGDLADPQAAARRSTG